MTTTIERLTSDQVQGNCSRDHSLVERINNLVDMIYDELFQQDRTVYVDPAGSDTEGNGTALRPWATFTRALRDIPRGHVLTIRPAAGTYTAFPRYVQLPDKGGSVVIDATHNAFPVAAGPYTLTAATGLSQTNPTYGAQLGYDYSVTGAGWATDAHYGRYIHWLTGAAAGYCYPIYSNTAEALRSFTDWYGIAPGDTFEIVTEPVVIDVDHAVTFHQPGAREQKDTDYQKRPHLALGGVQFRARGYLYSDPYAVCIDGARIIMSYAAFVNSDASAVTGIQVIDCNLNNLDPYSAGFLPFQATALNDWFAFAAHVMVRGGAVSPNVGRFIELRSSWVATVCARGSVNMVDGYTHLTFSMVASAGDDGHASVVEFLYVDQGTLSAIVALDIHDSTMYVLSAYVAQWNTPFINIRTGGMRAQWIREDNGNATHAVRIYRRGQMALLSTTAVTATGSVNAIRWGTTNGASGWPNPFSGVTDGAGSWVTKEQA